MTDCRAPRHPAPAEAGTRVWLLRTPSHDRLVLAEEQSAGEFAATVIAETSGNYSVTDITEAVKEFITLNPEWVARQKEAGMSTECPETTDREHCNHWQEGTDRCCACGRPPLDELNEGD